MSVLDSRAAWTTVGRRHPRSLPPFHCINCAFPVRALDESNEDVLHRFELGRGPRIGLRDPVIQAVMVDILAWLDTHLLAR